MSDSDELAKVVADHKNLNALSVLSTFFSNWDMEGPPKEVSYKDGKLYHGDICVAHVHNKTKVKGVNPNWHAELSHRIKHNYPHTQAIYMVATGKLKEMVTLNGGHFVDTYILEKIPSEVRVSFYKDTKYMTDKHIHAVLGFMFQSQVVSDIISLAGGIGTNLVNDPSYYPYDGMIGPIKFYGCIPYVSKIYDIQNIRRNSNFDIFSIMSSKIRNISLKDNISRATALYMASSADPVNRYIDISPTIFTNDKPVDICEGGSCDSMMNVAAKLAFMTDKSKTIINEDEVKYLASSKEIPNHISSLAKQSLSDPSSKLLKQLEKYVNDIHQNIRHRVSSISIGCQFNESPFYPEVVGDKSITLNVKYDSLAYDILNSVNGVNINGVTFEGVHEDSNGVYYIDSKNIPYSHNDIINRLGAMPYTIRSITGDMLSSYDSVNNTVNVKGTNYNSEIKPVSSITVYDPCQIGVYTRNNLLYLQMYTSIRGYLESIV